MDLNKLKYLQTINRIKNNSSIRDYYVEEMVNEYEENYNKIIDSFEVEINTSKATEGLINHIKKARVILTLENAKTSTVYKYYAQIECAVGLLSTGDYFTYTDKDSGRTLTLIVSSVPEKRHNYDKHEVCYAMLCNQTLMRYDFEEPVPCWCDNSSYGTKGEIDVNNFSILDGKVQILTQRNIWTNRFVQNERIIFDHDKNSVYEIVDLSSATNPGMQRIVANKTEYKPGYDDLENNIAWNRFAEEGTQTVEFEVVSSSNKFEILKNSTVTFTVRPKATQLEDFSPKWNISLENAVEGWCEIVEITNDSITIKNIKGYSKTPITILFSPLDGEYQEIRQEVKVKNY